MTWQQSGGTATNVLTPSFPGVSSAKTQAAKDRPRDLEAYLHACPWVQSLSDVAKERVLTDCYSESFQARTVVAHRGAIARSWIGVMDGLLKADTQSASGKTNMLCAIPINSWVGEGSVIKKEPRRYELVALRYTTIAHLPRATFMWLLETSTDFNRFIIDHLNERIGQFLGSMELLRISSPPARVAAGLCNLYNPVLHPGASATVKISQEEIGKLVGLSRPTTNGALKTLRESGLVRLEPGTVLILDLIALREFSTQSD